jgi:hypothetical protein
MRIDIGFSILPVYSLFEIDLMTKRRKILLTALLALSLYSSLSLAALLKLGDTLTKFEFIDQFDQPHSVDKQTRILFFAKSKHAGSLMTDIISDVAPDHLSKLNAVYIADISGMPSLVTRFIVMPKMRDIKVPILLVRESEYVAWLPREEDKVTVIKLTDGKVNHIDFTAEKETLRRLLGIFSVEK